MARSAAVAAWFVLLIMASPARGQVPLSLVVEAELIVFDQAAQTVDAEGQVRLSYRGIRLTADRARFDLRAEELSAEGHVVLVDAAGREFRGRRLRYDVPLQLAEVEQAEAIVERVYIRSETLRAQPERIVGENAVVTTCDPARPAYRVTASRVEIVPGDRLVARDASLWLGTRRLLTFPQLTLSLRDGEGSTAARSFPGAGLNHVDGLWVDYPYLYRLGPLDGVLYTKLAYRTGLIARASLTYPTPGYALSLTVGRNQSEDLELFDQAEAALDVPEVKLGALPLVFGFTLRSGWFREAIPALETSRSLFEVRLSTPAISLGARTRLTFQASLQDAYYGTGARQTVARGDVSLIRSVDPRSAVSLRYRLFERFGATPFVFDAIDEEDLFHEVALEYSRSFPQPAGVIAGYTVGTSYDFQDQTYSVNAGLRRQRPGDYHWDLGVDYNLVTRVPMVLTDSGRAFGGTYVTIQAAYFPTTGQFDYLDLLATARLCNCFNLTLKYRHVQQEFWLEVVLAPDERLAFPEEATQP